MGTVAETQTSFTSQKSAVTSEACAVFPDVCARHSADRSPGGSSVPTSPGQPLGALVSIQIPGPCPSLSGLELWERSPKSECSQGSQGSLSRLKCGPYRGPHSPCSELPESLLSALRSAVHVTRLAGTQTASRTGPLDGSAAA